MGLSPQNCALRQPAIHPMQVILAVEKVQGWHWRS
jgi:hypothetical protein